MIWLIGARWKYGNVWSRSVLIEALPFYAQTIALMLALVEIVWYTYLAIGARYAEVN